MPVARLISSNIEEALRFAEYLRAHFDTVEIAQPGRTYATTVDLEVNLELCTSEQAWQQISEASAHPETDVFIAPGVIAPAPEPEPVSEQSLAMEAASEVAEAAIANTSAQVVAAVRGNGSASHHGTEQLVAAEQTASFLGRLRESLREWMMVRALLHDIREYQAQRQLEEQAQQRQALLQFERERREREHQDWLAARAAAEQRQAEEQRLEQQHALRQPVEEEVALRPEAEEQGVAPHVPAPSALEPQPEPSYAAARRSVRISWPYRSPEPALAMAAVTSTLLMFGWMAYANRRPASPVPLSVVQRSAVVQQKVPFGPAIMPAAPPTASNPQAVAQVVTRPADVPVKHGFRQDFRRVRVGNHEVDYVAEDVTVRNFVPVSAVRPARSTKAAFTHSNGGVKQINDMDLDY